MVSTRACTSPLNRASATYMRMSSAVISGHKRSSEVIRGHQRSSATYMRMSARVRSRGSIGTTASSWAPSELARSGAELAPELAPEDTPEDAPQRCLTSLRLVSTSSEMSSREVWSSRNRMASSEFEKGSRAEALKRERLVPDEGGNQMQSDAIRAEALKREWLAPDEGGNQSMQ